MTVVIGTAGHIDHGKTTLLRALTGIDADRLPEERRRGMTIDVGYAHLDLPDGSTLDFVDVPGHDALIGNMLVGAGEVDAALLVVAADDGPRAQTREHLELLDALGVADGLAVITKIDAVEAARVAEIVAAVEVLLARTSLAGAPVVAVSAVSGEGLDRLRAELLSLRERVSPRAHDPAAVSGARLAIDRAFSVRGRGLVVTGTLRGTIARGDVVAIEPGGGRARVREVQVHDRAVERSTGGRTALALVGLDPELAHRGRVVLGGSADVRPTDRLLVALRAPVAWTAAGERSQSPRPGEVFRLHIGTDQADGRVLRPGSVTVAVGDESVHLLRLDRHVAAATGDRFSLRRPSPLGTAAAGRVLDPEPPRGPARRRMTADRIGLLHAARDRATRAAARLELHGALAGEGGIQAAADVRDALGAAARSAVASHHAASSDSPGLPLAELRPIIARAARRLTALEPATAAILADRVVADEIEAGHLARAGDRVREAGRAEAVPDTLARAMDRLEAALTVPAPPPLSEAARAAGCPAEGVQALATVGRIVRLEADLAWATSEFERLASLALAMSRSGPLNPAAFRDATGTSRRYVLALLEEFDRRGILRRTDAGRVPGPRVPR